MDVTPREQIAWIYRRAGFGLAPGELDDLEALGVDAVIDRLVYPDDHGIEPNPNPWAGVDLDSYADREVRGQLRRDTIVAWPPHMVTTPRPAEEWMRWFWHGHLVSSLGTVRAPHLMVGQMLLYGSAGLGSFRDLIYETTIDPAMLRYLNGSESHRDAPNENYARELMELFTLGVGNFTEADVQAAARALTGWRASVRNGTARFRSGDHDDTPQTLLGVSDVHDVDSVVDAVVGQEACPRFVTSALAAEILGGPLDPALIDELAGVFADSDLQVRPLLGAMLHAGADGRGGDRVQRPIPWLIGALKATGSDLGLIERRFQRSVTAMQQIPLLPPNVSGWPGDGAWLTSSVNVGRINAAMEVAVGSPDDAPALALAAAGDSADLADLLGHPEGFSDVTYTAMDDIGSLGRRPGEARLAVALASPEMTLA